MFEEIRDPATRVRALCDHGCRLTEIDTGILPARYFRSGREMIRMADVYYKEGSLEEAFILYSKFVTLFVEKLPKHPDYKSAPATDKAANKKMLTAVFPKAESIKTKLKEKYAAQEKIRLEEERKMAEAELKEMERLRLEEEKVTKEKEKLREEEARRRQELERGMMLESEEELRRLHEQEIMRSRQGGRCVAQPSIEARSYDGDISSFTAGLPPPPSYNSVISISGGRPEIPSRSLKPGVRSTTDTTIGGSVSSPSLPLMDHFTNVGETGLKTVYVPEPLIRHFLQLAEQNTAKAIETCAILCGKLEHSTWRITHLLMPHQHGTSDSCDIANEEDVAEYQDEHDLITLGWIHTHPTQTAFLSSVDQHTHWPFQKLLPEAIAIVCSPKFQETGFFYLTPDYGMTFIRGCTGRGFHEHPKHTPIFDTCPHVKIDSQASVTVVDLRHK